MASLGALDLNQDLGHVIPLHTYLRGALMPGHAHHFGRAPSVITVTYLTRLSRAAERRHTRATTDSVDMCEEKRVIRSAHMQFFFERLGVQRDHRPPVEDMILTQGHGQMRTTGGAGRPNSRSTRSKSPKVMK